MALWFRNVVIGLFVVDVGPVPLVSGLQSRSTSDVLEEDFLFEERNASNTSNTSNSSSATPAGTPATQTTPQTQSTSATIASCGAALNKSKRECERDFFEVEKAVQSGATAMRDAANEVNTSISDFVTKAVDLTTQLNNTVQTAQQAANAVGKGELVQRISTYVAQFAETVVTQGAAQVTKAQHDMDEELREREQVMLDLLNKCNLAINRVFGSAANFTVWPQVEEPWLTVSLEQKRTWPFDGLKDLKKFAPGGGWIYEAHTFARQCGARIPEYEGLLTKMKNVTMSVMEDAGAFILQRFDEFADRVKNAIDQDSDDSSSGGGGGIVGQISNAASNAAIAGIEKAVQAANKTIVDLIQQAANGLTSHVFGSVDKAVSSFNSAADFATTLDCQAEHAAMIGTKIHEVTDPYYVISCAKPGFAGTLSSTVCPKSKVPGDQGCFKSTMLRQGTCTKDKLMIPRDHDGKVGLETLSFSVMTVSDTETTVANFSLPDTGPISGVLIVAVQNTQGQQGAPAQPSSNFRVTTADGCKAAEEQLNVRPTLCNGELDGKR